MGTSAGWLKIGGKCPSEMVRLLPRRVVLKSIKFYNSPTFGEKKFGCAFGVAPVVCHFKFKKFSLKLG